MVPKKKPDEKVDELWERSQREKIEAAYRKKLVRWFFRLVGGATALIALGETLRRWFQ